MFTTPFTGIAFVGAYPTVRETFVVFTGISGVELETATGVVAVDVVDSNLTGNGPFVLVNGAVFTDGELFFCCPEVLSSSIKLITSSRLAANGAGEYIAE
ncbi:hypothetical protein [Limnobaculum parvum]|uniref:hypothetical protein n=1 Tax=Limnobaculum parvum TaxID=2172103 RepID=UPI00186508BC|nr:hypothetical protein [Limnobaculum parvum]